MTLRPHSPHRRGLLFGCSAAAFLAACGGGGGDPGTPSGGDPAIQEFSADRSSYFVGERARITVRYTGATARLEPLGLTLASGSSIETGALGGRQRLQLVVTTPGRPTASRDLWLDVRFRDRWLAAEPFASSFHAALGTDDGQVLVLGGSRGLGVLSDGVDRFDPATGRFQRIGALASGRANHTAVALPNGQALVVGGLTSSPDWPVAELVDGSSGAVQPAGPLVEPRLRHASLRLGDGRVLVVGGMGRNSAELWDPARRSWRRLDARMAHDREYATATELADGRVLIVGGHSLFAAPGAYVFAELLDPRTETITPLATGIGEMRQLHAAHACTDHGVLVLGGEVSTATVQPLASVLRFDPATLRFTAQAPLATPRTLVASVALPGDEVLLVGGEIPGDLASNTGVHYRAGDQRVLAPLPGGRAWHSVTRLPDGRVVVIGGESGNGAYVTQTMIYE